MGLRRSLSCWAWECDSRSGWWVYNGCPTLCSMDELMLWLWVLWFQLQLEMQPFLCSLVLFQTPCSSSFGHFLFFFFCHLCTQWQTHSQAAGRHFFPWKITLLDMTKFVRVCNGRSVPQCSQGCEGTKGSMGPRVLKCNLSLWETFIIEGTLHIDSTLAPEAAWRWWCSFLHCVLGWNEESLDLRQHAFSFPLLLPWVGPRLVSNCCLCSTSSLSSALGPLCLEQVLPCSLPIQLAPLLTCPQYFIFEEVQLHLSSKIRVWKEREVQSMLQIRRKWK